MKTVHIEETFGPILGMDQMCSGSIPEDLTVGETLLLKREDGNDIAVTVAALQAQQTEDGELSELVGIGLRGPDVGLIRAGDALDVQKDKTP